MKKYLTATLLLILSHGVFANTIIDDTKNWQNVPITVDTTTNTYTVTGTVPTDTTNYYYSYSGYRCFTTKRDIAGASFLTFKASVNNGSDIYCYAE